MKTEIPTPRQPLFPMVTRRRNIPWLWVILFAYPAASCALVEQISNVAMPFTMRKFIADPALIVFLGSINIAFNFIVAPWAAWKSDNIWTRFGRRRPFIMAGYSLLAISMILMPLAPNIAMLTTCIVIYQFCNDFGYSGPWTPLYYEMIPSHQRGRAVVIKRLGSVLAKVGFNLVLIGQFDKIHAKDLDWTFGLKPEWALSLTGEMMVYWVGAIAAILVVAQMLFLVREAKPPGEIERKRFSPMAYIKTVLGEKQYRMLFLLMFCGLALTAGLGQLQPLLITEQFHYSKTILGQMASITLAIEIGLILPLALFFLDRFDRFRVFQIGLILSTLHPICYWLFINYLAPGGVPSTSQIIAFGLWNSSVDLVAALALEPLIFDYVPRKLMGTINSGFLFVRGALGLLVINGVGLWVKFFTEWLRPERIAGGQKSYDYSGGYLYVFLIGCMGVAATIIFNRYRNSGKLVMYGRLEESGEDGTKES